MAKFQFLFLFLDKRSSSLISGTPNHEDFSSQFQHFFEAHKLSKNFKKCYGIQDI